MLKRIKILLKDNIFLIAISITVGIIYLSIIKIPSIGIEIANIDKGYHSLAYFMLAITWLLAFYKKQKKYVIVISCIIFGIIIEVLQYTLTTYRTGDYLDVFANSLGVFLALVVFNLFFRKKNIY
jgi:glycopeptide antibiotics resistance protein|tara:strand:- start:903 stop:1277 length:375 start_codon:yes stop_codon:yes gene_type:complete